MEGLFRDFWWLLFPIGWMLIAAWSSFLNDRRRRDAEKLIFAYRDKGQEPPPELVRAAYGKEG